MKTSRALFLVLATASGFVCAQQNSVPVQAPAAQPGPRIQAYQTHLKEIFPSALRFEEKALLPSQSGGTTMMGLVSRLLGDMPSPRSEGLRSERFIYQAFDKEKTVGAAHGSLAYVDTQVIPVFAYYDAFGRIIEVRAESLPAAVQKDFAANQTLKQFTGKNLEDFEVTRGKKGRIKSLAPVMSQLRRPGNAESRRYFDAIVRSMRFNASFMDIAHFMTQHPELADHIVAELSSSDGRTTALNPSVSPTGPEAFVREKETTSPFPLILPNPTQNPIGANTSANGR